MWTPWKCSIQRNAIIVMVCAKLHNLCLQHNGEANYLGLEEGPESELDEVPHIEMKPAMLERKYREFRTAVYTVQRTVSGHKDNDLCRYDPYDDPTSTTLS